MLELFSKLTIKKAISEPGMDIDKNYNRPDEALKQLIKENKFVKKNIVSLALNAERVPNKIRIVVISDTHSKISPNFQIPNADILIHAGDFTMNGRHKEIEEFNNFLQSLNNIPYKVVIAGNHEKSLDKKKTDSNVAIPRNYLNSCNYLEDNSVNILGLNIYGSPWQPYHCGNAFQLERGLELVEKWNQIPTNTDILVTHTPPLGYGDCYNGIRHAGCVDLYNTVTNRIKPKYHLFGHIHEDYGAWTNGETNFINASICNHYYKANKKPFLFDIDLPASE